VREHLPSNRKPYTRPAFRIFQLDATEFPQVLQAVSSGTDLKCRKAITEMQSRQLERVEIIYRSDKLMANSLGVLLQNQSKARMEQFACVIVGYGRMNAKGSEVAVIRHGRSRPTSSRWAPDKIQDDFWARLKHRISSPLTGGTRWRQQQMGRSLNSSWTTPHGLTWH